MKNLLFVFFILLTLNLFAQKINTELKAKLDSIMQKDQLMRELIDTRITEERKIEILDNLGLEKEKFYGNSAGDAWGSVYSQDLKNMKDIRQIIKEYGYPGKTLVGVPTNKASWYVIQHSDAIEEFFPLIKEAGQKNEISMTLVAIMEDRLLMQKGLEQKYGTQSYGTKNMNAETGEEEWNYYIWPIKDPENINSLRKSIGFTTTVQESAKRLGVVYKAYTLDEFNEIIKK
ncbi:MAG: DUF6624 domain-containing protein [Prolixibacteraceae bacterium]